MHTLLFVWKKYLCIHEHTDMCVKLCGYLWRESQESDCPYGESPGASQQLPRQRDLIFLSIPLHLLNLASHVLVYKKQIYFIKVGVILFFFS